MYLQINNQCLFDNRIKKVQNSNDLKKKMAKKCIHAFYNKKKTTHLQYFNLSGNQEKKNH